MTNRGTRCVLGNLLTGEIEGIDAGGLQIGIAAISPDGSEISFVEEDEGALWLMDIDGTGRRPGIGRSVPDDGYGLATAAFRVADAR